MNTFFYLDCCRYSVFNYEIKTDMSYNELLAFLSKKALQYCEDNDIDKDEYLNGEGDYCDMEFEVKINNKKYLFTLHTFLDIGYKRCLSTKPFQNKKMSIKFEDII